MRTNLTIHTYRKGKHETLACMGGYVLQRQDDLGWLIELKQINLIDADQAQGEYLFYAVGSYQLRISWRQYIRPSKLR